MLVLDPVSAANSIKTAVLIKYQTFFCEHFHTVHRKKCITVEPVYTTHLLLLNLSPFPSELLSVLLCCAVSAKGLCLCARMSTSADLLDV